MKNTFFGLALALSFFARPSSAKEKQHLPLPTKVLSAKSVFIDNQSGMASLGDKAFDQLKKWGRFQVVSDRKEADLILLLSAREYNGGYVTTGGGQTGTVDESGNIETTGNPTYTSPVTVRYTFLTVIDPSTGANLWSDSKEWGNLYNGFHSATRGLIQQLKKRIDEQAALPKKDSNP